MEASRCDMGIPIKDLTWPRHLTDSGVSGAFATISAIEPSRTIMVAWQRSTSDQKFDTENFRDMADEAQAWIVEMTTAMPVIWNSGMGVHSISSRVRPIVCA